MNNKTNYNLLETFVKVSELGSFTQAAINLKQPKSRVSRAINKLETDLGAQLIRRTTRKVTLTNSGQELFRSISPLLKEIKDQLEKIANYQQSISGKIRITASEDIAQTIVATAVSEFQKRYPLTTFETIVTNEFLDLTKENIDIAFRAGRLKDSGLIQRKIMSVKFICVCSPHYIEKYGCISNIEDLKKHNFLSFKNIERKFIRKSFSPKPFIVSDSMPMILNMTVNNCGIAILPSFFCQNHLKDNSLKRVASNWESKTENIHILFTPTKNMPKKIKLFNEMVSSLFKT